MPGRSWMTTSLWPLRRPSFFSTVTPGQLPTYWLEPVRSLNSVVLPQFGLPASAILIAIAKIPLSLCLEPGACFGHSTSTMAASALRMLSS